MHHVRGELDLPVTIILLQRVLLWWWCCVQGRRCCKKACCFCRDRIAHPNL